MNKISRGSQTLAASSTIRDTLLLTYKYLSAVHIQWIFIVLVNQALGSVLESS